MVWTILEKKRRVLSAHTCYLLARGRPQVNASISGIAHAQCAKGLHFSVFTVMHLQWHQRRLDTHRIKLLRNAMAEPAISASVENVWQIQKVSLNQAKRRSETFYSSTSIATKLGPELQRSTSNACIQGILIGIHGIQQWHAPGGNGQGSRAMVFAESASWNPYNFSFISYFPNEAEYGFCGWLEHLLSYSLIALTA